jgi:hypothetical protein
MKIFANRKEVLVSKEPATEQANRLANTRNVWPSIKLSSDWEKYFYIEKKINKTNQVKDSIL